MFFPSKFGIVGVPLFSLSCFDNAVQHHSSYWNLCTILQAEEMSKKIRNLSDKQVELLLKGASWLSRGATLAQQVKAKIMRNKLLMLGFLLLLVAVILRYFKVLV